MPHETTPPLDATKLKQGDICVSVSYLDEALLVPIVETFVFIGVDILNKGGNELFFQSAESYFSNGPYRAGDNSTDNKECLLVAPPDTLSNMFDVQHASEVIERCAERWRLRHNRFEAD